MKLLKSLFYHKNPFVFRWGFFLLFVFIEISAAYSQKVIQKSWEATAFNKVEIISDEVFTIKIASEETSKIRLIAKVEGENYESVVVSSSENKKTLTIKTPYRPFFKRQNDKLAAHKLISIELMFYVPKGMEIYISSRIASLEAQGNFQKLDVNLREGNCIVRNFLGDASINTNHGDIHVYAKYNVSGVAFSENGIVKNELPFNGIYTIKAQSVNGDISLFKTTE